jgi:hypothetical protein
MQTHYILPEGILYSVFKKSWEQAGFISANMNLLQWKRGSSE